jgi:hypothetical protein
MRRLAGSTSATSGVLALTLLLAAAGCKKEEVPVKQHTPPPVPANVKNSVEGHIRYHGVGLASGSVQFFGPSGDPVVGTVMMGGTYVVWNAPTGLCKIAITTRPPSNVSKAPPAKHAGNNLPERYADPDSSGLTLQVTGGKQTFDIVLQD